MSFPPSVTVIVLIVFLLVALVPPRLPLAARIGIQVLGGLVLYFGFSEAMFGLPNGDNLPLSDLYGGRGGAENPPFNKLALGVVGPVLGVLLSFVVAGIRKILNKGQGDD